MSTRTMESRRDRVILAEDAGWGRLSGVSILAGALAGYGAFALLLILAAAIVTASGNDPGSFTAHDWRTAGIAGGAIVAVLMFASYLFGGYVAGRMARRAGTTHGGMVFVTGLVVAIGIGALIRFQGDTSTLRAALRDLGIPTTWKVWRQAGIVAGIGSLAGMLLGSMLGGALGERWHGKLLRRAADPEIGPVAEARAAAANREEEAESLRRAAMTRADHGSSLTGPQPVLHATGKGEHPSR